MLFWAQWKMYGSREAPWHLWAIGFHLAAVALFALLALTLYRRFAVPIPELGMALCGVIFVLGLYLLPAQQGINAEVYSVWKNQPDSLCLSFFCLSLWAYLQQGERPSVAPTIWYVLACLTKEAGVFLPLLLPILEFSALREGGKARRAAVRRMLPSLIALPFFLLWRTFCLHTAIGFQYGSNGSWGFRLLANALGPLSEAFALGAIYPLALTIALFGIGGVLALYRRSIIAAPLQRRAILALIPLVFLAVATIAAWIDHLGFDPAIGVSLLLRPEYLPVGGAIALYAFALLTAVRRFPNLTAFALAWAWLALALTLFSPSVLHRYYFVHAGQALLLGAGLSFLLPATRLLQTGSGGEPEVADAMPPTL